MYTIQHDGEFVRIVKTETTITITEEREEEMKPGEREPNEKKTPLYDNDALREVQREALAAVADTIQNRCSPAEMPELVSSLISLVERLEVFR